MPIIHPNHRLVNIHRSYTVEEIANPPVVHRNTVREWINRGPPTVDKRRSLLVRKATLHATLANLKRFFQWLAVEPAISRGYGILTPGI
ncbi:hypothetical protein ACTRXD_19100 [Nitrospira sp. T9]|uniref:hypothetical protein n=1 Tax=unclassified Nitrospira TaxID=2652172 RepID=UPI003F9B4A61